MDTRFCEAMARALAAEPEAEATVTLRGRHRSQNRIKVTGICDHVSVHLMLCPRSIGCKCPWLLGLL
jgi:hypothetical protein